MNHLNQVLKCFSQFGFNNNDLISKRQAFNTLDELAQSVGRFKNFDKEVFQQLWEHCPKNSGHDKVYVQHLAQTVCEAQQILKDHIIEGERNYKREQDNSQRDIIKEDLIGDTQDLRLLTQTFDIRSNMQLKLQNEGPAGNYNRSFTNTSTSSSRSSSIFGKNINQNRKTSFSLTVIAHISFVLLLIELMLMFQKHHFHNLMLYLGILSIFFLNYFDRVYIRTILLSIVVSEVLDILWIIFKAQKIWSSGQVGFYSQNQSTFLLFSVFFTIVCIALKFFMILILFKYRKNMNGLRKKAYLFCLTFKLDANPIRNPVSNLLAKTAPKKLIG